jgi:hypothetical protein
MLNAAEDGQRHQLPIGRWRLPELGVGIWDPMDGLRRPRAIVVANVLTHNATDVIHAEEDEVVQGFLAQRPVESLDVRRSVGRTVGDGQAFDAHDLTQPLVEVATISASAIATRYRHSLSVLAEDPIIVMNQEAWRLIPVCRRPNLLLHPGQRGIARDVDMYDATRSHFHHDEDVGDGKEGGVLRQEVTGPHLAGVVANEGAPGLAATGPASHHVDSDGTGRMVDAELGGQFLGDLVLAPAWLVG